MNHTRLIKRLFNYKQPPNRQPRFAGTTAPHSTQHRKLLIENLERRQLLTGDIPPLLDINPGVEAPMHLTEMNGILYFSADDGTHGLELWRSDGTQEGTFMVKDAVAGIGGTSGYYTNMNGELFFSTWENSRSKLWKSDGTEDGTVVVKEFSFDSNTSFETTNVGGTLFFAVSSNIDDFNLWQLWKSDGTESGTVLVKVFSPSQIPYQFTEGPRSLTNVNGTLYFVANDGVRGKELWKSDGTDQGTVLVKDINPGPLDSDPWDLVEANGTLYFRANDGTHGVELWKTDGTNEGTVLVKDLRPGTTATSLLRELTNVNGTLFFRANDGTHGVELWKSDGTEAGTTMVKDIRTGTGSSSPGSLTNVDGLLYFRANDGSVGSELWKSDGTAIGTVLVKDINPGGYFSAPRHLANIGGLLYFAANDGTHGHELWKSDGTADGTQLVMNISEGTASSNPGLPDEQNPTGGFMKVGNRLFFTAETATYGRELYVLELPTAEAIVQSSHVYHAGSSFAVSGIESALDNSKQLAKEGVESQTLTYDNLINSSRGINGLVFDFQNLPGSPSANLTADDFQFQMSPTGAFIEADHPPADWEAAPVSTAISVVAGTQGLPDRVVIEWPDNAIANRWLRVTIKATANTGLPQSEVYYLGHLLGETTGPADGVYTVSFADIAPIRGAVGESVDAGSIHDIDKSGLVSFADISAMRPQVGTQLTNITIPAGSATDGEIAGATIPGEAWIIGQPSSSSAVQKLPMANLQVPAVGMPANWPEPKQPVIGVQIAFGGEASEKLLEYRSAGALPLELLAEQRELPGGVEADSRRTLRGIEESPVEGLDHTGWATELNSLLDDPVIIQRWARG